MLPCFGSVCRRLPTPTLCLPNTRLCRRALIPAILSSLLLPSRLPFPSSFADQLLPAHNTAYLIRPRRRGRAGLRRQLGQGNKATSVQSICMTHWACYAYPCSIPALFVVVGYSRTPLKLELLKCTHVYSVSKKICTYVCSVSKKMCTYVYSVSKKMFFFSSVK